MEGCGGGGNSQTASPGPQLGHTLPHYRRGLGATSEDIKNRRRRAIICGLRGSCRGQVDLQCPEDVLLNGLWSGLLVPRILWHQERKTNSVFTVRNAIYKSAKAFFSVHQARWKFAPHVDIRQAQVGWRALSASCSQWLI